MLQRTKGRHATTPTPVRPKTELKKVRKMRKMRATVISNFTTQRCRNRQWLTIEKFENKEKKKKKNREKK
jgi:hypothetical protein